MKRLTSLAILLLSIILFACSGNFELQDSSGYTPPTVKKRPRLMYPKSAQMNSFTGKSKAILLVSDKGIVEQVDLTESTGSEILDEAAIDYCRKLVFNPALRNNKPVTSRIEWGFQFSILDQDWDPYIYVNTIQQLYSQLFMKPPSERIYIERKILAEHNNYVFNMRDVINYNSFLEKVISSDLVDGWKNEWDSWPLSFLIYHDFIQRFPEYDSLAGVKQQLKNAVSFDIEYINNSKTSDIKDELAKQKLLDKIKSFMLSEYPDIYESSYSTRLNPGITKQYL